MRTTYEIERGSKTGVKNRVNKRVHVYEVSNRKGDVHKNCVGDIIDRKGKKGWRTGRKKMRKVGGKKTRKVLR